MFVPHLVRIVALSASTIIVFAETKFLIFLVYILFRKPEVKRSNSNNLPVTGRV